MEQRYFFDQDQDCHWYLVPAPLKETWDTMTENDMDSEEEIDKFCRLFDQYRIDGHPSFYTFTDPQPE